LNQHENVNVEAAALREIRLERVKGQSGENKRHSLRNNNESFEEAVAKEIERIQKEDLEYQKKARKSIRSRGTPPPLSPRTTLEDTTITRLPRADPPQYPDALLSNRSCSLPVPLEKKEEKERRGNGKKKNGRSRSHDKADLSTHPSLSKTNRKKENEETMNTTPVVSTKQLREGSSSPKTRSSQADKLKRKSQRYSDSQIDTKLKSLRESEEKEIEPEGFKSARKKRSKKPLTINTMSDDPLIVPQLTISPNSNVGS